MFLILVLLLVSLPDSSQEDCHCQNECTNFPGSPCPGTLCQTDWFGSYCQKRNIARGKPTSQSSILQGYDYASSDKAVDGNTDQRFEGKSCTHTDVRASSGAEWRVNFTTTLEIRQMRIYLRDSMTERNVGLQVKVGDKLCYTLSEQQTDVNIDCGEALSGSSVSISVPGNILTLCEVHIFQCSDGWFGSDCDKQCQCQDTTEVCDKETGYCRNGCAAGKQGLGCQQDCGQNLYGIQCSFTCGQCSGSSDCKKDDGTCTQGCQQGYLFPLCRTCASGYYGSTCTGCGRCQNNAPCNTADGRCEAGCQTGYQGPLCQECRDGWFGSDCDKQCQCQDTTDVCDKVTGNCRSGCAAGKQGQGCQQDCGQNRYGIQCSFTCGQCSGTSDCKKDDGTCTQGCKQGYSWPLCKTCQSGYYGSTCTSRCGHCQNKTPCNTADGRCDAGCETGYQGPLCQVCAVHFYGPTCQGCGHCKDDSACSVLNGTCMTGCKPGYEPPLCNTACIPGRYGEGCLHTCGHCQINGSCNAQTGRCESNCQPGYMGPLCTQECADYTYGINCSGVCSCLHQCEVCDKVTGDCRTGHQSTTTAAVGASEAQQGQGHEDIRLIVVSCLLAIACVYAVITTANNYRIRHSMKILKAEQMQMYSTLQVRGESSVYDVIAERNVYANESIQRDGDQDPNEK